MTAMNDSFDVLVIGAGPGGYVAAIRAAQHGLRTAIVERGNVGGVCLNVGCIPTKAMLHGAQVAHTLADAGTYGFTVPGGTVFDIGQLVKFSDSVVSQLVAGVRALLAANGVEVITGSAKLTGKGEVSVTDQAGATPDGRQRAGEPHSAETVRSHDGTRRPDASQLEDAGARGSGRILRNGTSAGPARVLHADHVIVATGARPRVLPGITPDGKNIWTSTDALRPTKLPESLVIIGSGAIGTEFASLYAGLGTRVTLLEALDSILPAEDAAVSAAMVRQLQAQGVRCEAGVRVVSVTSQEPEALAGSSPADHDMPPGSILGSAEAGSGDAARDNGAGVTTTITLANGQSETIHSEHVLVAAGVVPNTEGLGLAELGVRFERGFIATDEWCRTGVAELYAIGDVAGGPCLAHKASHEAIICVDHLAGVAGVRPLDRVFVPRCTYSRPQIASLGYTEKQAREFGRRIEMGVFDLAANGKALAQGEAAGFVKTIFDSESGELLGAHMVGPEVTEMIQGFSIARSLEATADELAETVFPHPSVSEAMHESVLASLGRAIHALP